MSDPDQKKPVAVTLEWGKVLAVQTTLGMMMQELPVGDEGDKIRATIEDVLGKLEPAQL